MLKKSVLYGIASLCLFVSVCKGQAVDSIVDKGAHFPAKLLDKIQSKTALLNRRLIQQTDDYLRLAARREECLRGKLSRKDSAGAATLFGNFSQRYASLAQKLRADTGDSKTSMTGEYLPNLDSLRVSLNFLQKNQQLVSGAGGSLSAASQQSLLGSISKLQALQARMQDASQVEAFIQQRQQQVADYISRHAGLAGSLGKEYAGLKQQAFYYSQQLKEYKDMWKDPEKSVRAAIRMMNKVPAFSIFMAKNSLLASIFNVPAGSEVNATPTTQIGMPGRDQVLTAFRNQSGVAAENVPSVVQGNVSSAQDQTAGLQDKMSALGNGGGGDPDIPDFKPNLQRTKSFFKRLEYGANLQTVQSTYFFPVTTDVALSLGYKLNDKNRIGIGAGYKFGWGKDIRHIQMTSQGVSLRSFGDFLIRRNIYASGGFEYNYQQPFASLAHLPDLRDWQKSALFGVSRIVSIRSKVCKTMKMSILWDALSYQQVPKTPPVKFRLGYTF